jgi:hypothetical protein
MKNQRPPVAEFRLAYGIVGRPKSIGVALYTIFYLQ